MRRLIAGLSTVLLLAGALAPGVLAACCEGPVHACCAKAADPDAARGIVRPPCCTRAQVSSPAAAVAIAPERSAPPAGVLAIPLRTHGARGQPVEAQRRLTLLVPCLQRALGPPLRLRI